MSQICLKNIQIVGGVAFLQNDNIVKIGEGVVHALQKEHRRRLYEELDLRMDEDEEDALVRSRFRSFIQLAWSELTNFIYYSNHH